MIQNAIGTGLYRGILVKGTFMNFYRNFKMWWNFNLWNVASGLVNIALSCMGCKAFKALEQWSFYYDTGRCLWRNFGWEILKLSVFHIRKFADSVFFFMSSSVPADKWQVPFTCFPVGHSVIVQPFNTAHDELLRASLNCKYVIE